MSLSVERLSSAHRDESVAVLCESFHDYPVMRFVLADAGRRYDEHLAALVAYFCSRRLVGNGWVLGAMEDRNLAGVSVFDVPGDDSAEEREEHQFWLQALVRDIGESAARRLEEYDQIGEPLMPAGAYHYLGMLGVLSRYQGRGLGRRLVEATQALAQQSEVSTGVCLHTEMPGNVPLYEHLGFETIGEADVGPMHTWCMFWPTKETA